MDLFLLSWRKSGGKEIHVSIKSEHSFIGLSQESSGEPLIAMPPPPLLTLREGEGTGKKEHRSRPEGSSMRSTPITLIKPSAKATLSSRSCPSAFGIWTHLHEASYQNLTNFSPSRKRLQNIFLRSLKMSLHCIVS